MLYGAVKTIDYAGRIVLPRQYRDELGLEPGSKVVLYLDNGKLTLEAVAEKCKLCGCKEIVDDTLPLCKDCLEKAKNFNK